MITIEKSEKKEICKEKTIALENRENQEQDINSAVGNKILLVEDNDLNIEITTKILEEMGVICDVAKDGIDAIKKIEEVRM